MKFYQGQLDLIISTTESFQAVVWQSATKQPEYSRVKETLMLTIISSNNITFGIHFISINSEGGTLVPVGYIHSGAYVH